MRKQVWIAILAVAFVVAAFIFIRFNIGFPKTRAVVEASKASPDSIESLNSVYINEVMAKNPEIIPDPMGEFFDWVELYNPTSDAINLSGYGLSDKVGEIRWMFPSGSKIAPNGYLVIYCSGIANKTSPDSLYTNFKLNGNRDTLVLTTQSGVVLDQLALLPVSSGFSFGRDAVDPMAWIEIAEPSPGFVNNEQGRIEYLNSMKAEKISVILNEFQAHNVTTYPAEDGTFPDWIELYNDSDQPFNLSNYALSDNLLKPLKWRFPEGTIIEPKEYLLVYTNGTVSYDSSSPALQANFKLSGYQGVVVFSNQQGQIIESINYDEIPVDESYARKINTDEWAIEAEPSPKYENTPKGHTLAMEQLSFTQKDLYISEVMSYNMQYLKDVDGQLNDWIELHNSGSEPLDISGFNLSNNPQYPTKWRFPENTVIEPNGYLTVLASGTVPRNAETKKKSEFLQLNYRLSNKHGEILMLWDRDRKLVDRLATPSQKNRYSYGRDEKMGQRYIYPEPTPNEENSKGFVSYASMPVIELAAGFYRGPQTVSIRSTIVGANVYYTLDGSEPTKESNVYTSPISIDKTTVVRARTFVDGGDDVLGSQTATSTYLIDSPHNDKLSVVSLATDAKNFYDPKIGIYVKGSNAGDSYPFKGANFWNDTIDWERPVHAEIFTPSGEQQVSQDMIIRIFGAYSRGRDQKGLALVARSSYGPPTIDFPLFPNREATSYKSIVLRASGQDSTVTKMRDIIATSLVDGTTNLEVQAYRQSVVYLNGEYFGIYNIREKVSKYFIAAHYGLKNPENIDLLVGNGTALVGGNAAYKALLEYCKTHDLSNADNYAYVVSQVDVDNYIDYLFCEMYIANTDTGNIKFFREKSSDPTRNKWRWIYYDFCWSLSNYKMDSVSYLTNPAGHGVGKGFSTELTRAMLQNQDFRNAFLRRSAELLNTTYTTERVLGRISECESTIIDEIERDVERWPEEDAKTGWRQSVGNWKANVKGAKKFAEERPGYIISYLAKYFKLSESETQSIFGRLGTPL